jgi:hypothetical protein
MADLRFFRRAGPFTLSEIAAHLGAEALEAHRGSISIHDIGDLDSSVSLPTRVISKVSFEPAPVLSYAAASLRGMRAIRRG